MKRVIGSLVLAASVMGFGLSSTLMGYAQSPAEKVLIDRAHALETRGRVDMAAQTWQQILLSDPNNAEALAGMARCAKLNGNDAEAAKYIDRLRQINPNDPNVNKVQGLNSTKVQNAQLQQASKLAQQGQSEQALKIYRGVFGNKPPDGDWALAYYDTEAATDANRADAIAGLQDLAKKYPADTRYSVTLGRILTYNQKTRAEGERILRQHPEDAAAQGALRQALQWDAQNPSAAPGIRAYLKEHPDQELKQQLEDTEQRQAKAQAQSGLAGTPDERLAYEALQANHVDEAEQRFQAITTQHPDDARALAGLGFVRMKQGNFGAAITSLEQAEQNGLKVAAVESALSTSRFWFAMSEATTALNSNQMDEAIAKYKAALAMKPTSPDALSGLAGAYMKEQQPAEAIAVYQQIVKTQPGNAAGWRGLFLAQSQAGNPKEALATAQRFPAAVKSSLASDPEYLRALAAAYTAAGQDAQAKQVLARALNLPFPDNGKNMKAETRLQYAGILMQDKLFNQAAGLYTDILAEDPNNVGAWQALVDCEHQMNLDADAVATVERMPPAAYDVALEDPGFLSTLAAVYQQQNQLDLASGFLERAAKLESSGGHEPAVPLQLQLAAIYLQRNNPGQAYSIYRRVLMAHPDRLDGWKGLMSALHQTGHDQEALAQMQQIPASVKRTLASDPGYQQTLAAVYASTGNSEAALVELNKIQVHYQGQNMAVPADVDVQSAWLLFNAKDDRALYPTLMRLGGRSDLSDEQRRQVQTIWANWSVRRASQAADSGNTRKALTILNAAAQTFPGNPAVSKALAGGYLRAGEPKQALEIFESLDMTNAPATDYQSAVGAALAAQDTKQAEAWLRDALELYPNDPQILASAARFEQARGDHARAAAYWRASLKAMPAASPGSELAEALGTPDAPRRQRTAQSTNLASLLNPDAESPAGRAAQQIPLPSYNSPAQGYPDGGAATRNAPRNYIPANNDPDYPPTNSAPTSYAPANAAPGNYGPAADPNGAMAPVQLPAPTAATPAPSARGRKRSKDASAAPPIPQASTQRLGDYQPRSSRLAPDSLTGADDADSAVAQDTPDPSSSPWNTPRQASAPRVVLPPVEEVMGAPAPSDPDATVAAAEMTPPPAQPIRRLRKSPLPLSAEPQQADDSTASSTEPIPSTRRIRKSQIEVPTLTSSSRARLDEAPVYSGPQIRFVPNAGNRSIEATHEALAAAVRPLEQQSFQVAQYTPPSQDAPQYTPPPYSRQPAAPQFAPATASNPPASGASDDDLVQRNLPPLRGSIVRSQQQAQPRDPRQEAQLELAEIEGGYSPWIGQTGSVTTRSGAPGFDKLTTFEAPLEASSTLGNSARLTLVTRPSFLDAGIVDGTSTDQLGTLSATALPAQQLASGVGGELQLTTSTFGASVGYTPYGFLVSNAIGRVNIHPGNGPITVTFVRDAVKDTQLSYSGLRDPGSASPVYDGNIWGGVVSNSGQLQYARGDARSGMYVQGGGQYITGHHVPNNTRVDGDAGAYWRVLALPEYGTLSLGVNFFGMHYGQNLRYFTYGQGGYFSPEAYLLAGVPISWIGHYGPNFHYSVNGSIGGQAFQEESAAYFPLDTALEAASSNSKYPARTSVGGNYDFHTQGSYRIADHWFLGGFLAANNSRDYNTVNAGFFVRYMFRPQYPTETAPTGLFPYEGLRPVMVP